MKQFLNTYDAEASGYPHTPQATSREATHEPDAAKSPLFTIEPDAGASGYPHTRQATTRETMPQPAASAPPHCYQGDRCEQVRIDNEYV